jgi:signal transduction histidine kinase
MRVPVASEDLTELMGALIENAARFAHRRVRIVGENTARLVVYIEDDGPGMDASAIGSVSSRGGRLDEAGGARGRGLEIARDLAEATGAELILQRSAFGGLRASVAWNWPAASGVADPVARRLLP